MFKTTSHLHTRIFASQIKTRDDSGVAWPSAVIAFFCLGLLLVTGCGQSEQADAADEVQTEVARNVRSLTITTTDLNEYLTISGSVVPQRGTILYAEESGQVKSIDRDKGKLVETGDILVQLDYQMLEANLKAADAAAELAEYNENRTSQLYEANSVSRIEMLEAKTSYQSARAAADVALIRRDHTAIKAPYDGVVADRFVELGELVSPGMPVARIVDPFVLKLVSAVSEREVSNLKPGDSAELMVTGLTNRLPATVHWVGFEADPTSGKFKVEIQVNNQDRLIRPGVIGNARILKNTHQDVILIPRDAIIQKSNGPVVFVINNDRAEERAIELGADEGLLTVVNAGLHQGDRLIVRGHRDVRPGCLISVTEESEQRDGTNSTDPRVVSQDQIVQDS